MLENAVVYDIETFPNCFTLTVEPLNSSGQTVWEISDFRDDRLFLIQFFEWLNRNQIPMIGFNNLNFDYRVLHFIYKNPNCTVQQIYDCAMEIINSNDRFSGMIWVDDRFAPQIDLFKIHHFDNKAKSTSLKALEINMRSNSVVDMPVPVGTYLTADQINNLLIPYNGHDVTETKKFTFHSMDAINFRISQIPEFGLDVLNWPDTKIGSRLMEKKIGHDFCYGKDEFGRKTPRQTPRGRIALNDIIFPYISFEHPEFNRVLSYLKAQVLTAEEMNQFSDDPPVLKTKGVFTDLKATINGFDFCFGTGGIHGSVEKQKIVAQGNRIIRDIDVAALYPSIAIVNRLYPEHLGQRFVEVYAELPKERKEWQSKKGKKCVEANTLKLASNGVYGNSNNKFSVFFDPQFTLTITINGQLLLCMLAERLLKIPTLKIIQINTDGITYSIDKNYEPCAAAVCSEWEKLTLLTLESVDYSRMWIRDVNNYIAESLDGSLKTKGAYWTPDPTDYSTSISNAQPSAWYKDLSNVISTRAAVAEMVHGVPVETFLKFSTNPFDYILRAKVRRSDRLVHGKTEIQKTSRYFVSKGGEPLHKVSPPKGTIGAYKRAPKVSEAEYNRVMSETGGQWDERVCTKNKSTYQPTITAIQAGHNVTICNDIGNFNFNDLNYDYYINEARKLVIK